MSTFYNPVKYPPKYRVRRYGIKQFIRSDYAGTGDDGQPIFTAVSLHASAEDAMHNRNAIADLRE